MPSGVYKRTPEMRAKMRASHLGVKLSTKHRAAIGAAKIGNTCGKGYKHTAEEKAKISAAQLGRKYSVAHRIAIGIAGRNRNPEGIYISCDNRAVVRVVSGWEKRARVVWVMKNGPIKEDYVVHHEDEDTMNDNITNLRCWTRGYHNGHHDRKRAA